MIILLKGLDTDISPYPFWRPTQPLDNIEEIKVQVIYCIPPDKTKYQRQTIMVYLYTKQVSARFPPDPNLPNTASATGI